MSSTLRFQVVGEAFNKKPIPVPNRTERPSEFFGKYVFNRKKMYQYLPANVYKKMCAVMDNGETLDLATANIVAEGMKKWVSSSGLSVRRLKQNHRDARHPAEASEQEAPLSAFVQFTPASVPAASEPLHGVHINFPDGVNLTLQECTPEGIVTLLDTYARRTSAREAGCSL